MATKGSKSFMTIPKKECLIVYKKIWEHSEGKWTSGKKLAEAGDYGGATSFAIISIEELVKCLIVFFDGKGFEFRKVKGIKTIFENHQIRYLIAFAMFIIGLAGEELVKFINAFKNDPQGLAAFVKRLQTDKEFLESTVARFALRKLVILKREFDWFSQVDIFRQEGFYSDYNEQLKSPISITKDDYEEVINRLEKVRLVGKYLIESVETKDMLFQKQIGNIRRDFKANKIYEKAGTALTSVKLSKVNPFEFIKGKMNNNSGGTENFPLSLSEAFISRKKKN